MLSLALIVPLTVANRFADKLAPNVPSKILRNLSFCSFASFKRFANVFYQ